MFSYNISATAESGCSEKKPNCVFRFEDDKDIQALLDSRTLVTQTGQKPFATPSATATIMENSLTWAGRVRLNLLTQKVEYDGRAWTDDRTVSALIWFERHRCATTRETFELVLDAIAAANAYDPVREYLDGVVWDGVDRFPEALSKMGIDPADLQHRRAAYDHVLPCWMTSAVARIYEPGCQADLYLTLAGDQGHFKSTWFRTMFAPWFTDSLPDVRTADAHRALAGQWCVLFDELPKSRRDKDAFKAFVTAIKDDVRQPYARRFETHPRRCVFGATVNPVNGFLDDPTGERRALVIHVDQPIDRDWFKANRDQLWAQAAARYRNGDSWDVPRYHIDGLLEGAFTEHPLQEPVEAWIIKNSHRFLVTAHGLLNHLDVPMDHRSTALRAVSEVLKRLGYKSKKGRDRHGRSTNAWFPREMSNEQMLAEFSTKAAFTGADAKVEQWNDDLAYTDKVAAHATRISRPLNGVDGLANLNGCKFE